MRPCAHVSLQDISACILPFLLSSLSALAFLQFLTMSGPILPQDLSHTENTLFFPWHLRGDFLTPRWVRPCCKFSLYFVFLYQTIFHKGNCSSILSVWIFNVSLICGSIYIYFSFPFCARMILDLSENLPLSLHSFHHVDTREFFLKTKGIAPLRVGKHAFCQEGGAIYIPMTESCWCMAETKTAFIVKAIILQLKINYLKKKMVWEQISQEL